MPTLVNTTITATGPFAAYDKATSALRGCGFSVGRMQARAPTGVMFGEFDIQKWRNLTGTERAALHGTITGDFRNGPVFVLVGVESGGVAARLHSVLRAAVEAPRAA